MKYFLILTFLSQLSYSQTILPNANTIVIKNVSFTEVCMRLLDSGYVIDKKDNDMQTVRTESKVYPRYWNAAYKISVRVKDSTAYLTGTYIAPYDQWLTKAANKTDPLFNNDPVYNLTNNKG